MIIMVKYLKGGEPNGRDYSFYSNVPVVVGDIVLVTESVKGKVTAIDVPFAEIEAFADKVKTIVGKGEERTAVEKIRDRRDAQGIDGNWNTSEYMLGLYNGLELSLSVLEDREPVYRSLERLVKE